MAVDSNDKNEIPTEFLCPITCEIMSDPHITLSGHTYEKYAIEQWLSTHNTDPLTNGKLTNKILIPNHTLRKQIQSFVEKNNIKLRSNKSSPFKYLLRLLRIHANQLKAMHVSSNLLQRYSHLFIEENKSYTKIIQRYISDWKASAKSIEAKWIDILANIIEIKEKIYKYHTINFDSSDEENDIDNEEKLDVYDLFQNHIIGALISIKTSLREIVGIQTNLKFTIQFFFEYTDINGYVRQKKKHNNNNNNNISTDNNDEKQFEIVNFDNNNDEDSTGLFSNDFEEDLTAFSMIAGGLIGGNACGATGAAIGSVAGPVGTLFGACIGFYVGAIAGSTPSMIYGLYIESEKVRQQEVDRLWKLIHLGLKKYDVWIDKEKNEFNVCDQIILQCMDSIIYCIDHKNDDNNGGNNYNDDEIDFIYQCVDDELIEIWQYDISRITPILQECLVKTE